MRIPLISGRNGTEECYCHMCISYWKHATIRDRVSTTDWRKLSASSSHADSKNQTKPINTLTQAQRGDVMLVQYPNKHATSVTCHANDMSRCIISQYNEKVTNMACFSWDRYQVTTLPSLYNNPLILKITISYGYWNCGWCYVKRWHW